MTEYEGTEKPQRAARFFRRVVSLADSLVDFVVLILLLAMLAFGSYALWDSQQVSSAASRTRFEVYKPSSENSYTFDELREINPEVIGWITVYGTNIDYPLVQSSESNKYINTAADGTYSLSGAIFLDSLCPADFSAYNSVIHGHNMAGDVMFGQLKNFSEPDYFSAHRFGNLYYNGQNHGLVIFEHLQADAYDFDVYNVSVNGREEQTEYLELLRGMSTQYRDAGQGDAEHIVLLSTCALGYTNGRDILACVIMDQTFEDDFTEEETENSLFALDSLKRWNEFDRLPLWIWALILFGFILLVYIIFSVCCSRACKRRARKAEMEFRQRAYEMELRQRAYAEAQFRQRADREYRW
ncbi:MAG: class B sortase [Eubacteriales bacterium]|nr:class B sortase [Eubacteriales bacterium]